MSSKDIKYSICILDDKIPLHDFDSKADDTRIIEERVLYSYLADEKKWKDSDLLNFVKLLNKEKDKYFVSGFTHYDFFLNHVKDVLYSPDIIIFDWDFPGPDNSEESLLKILETKYCVVLIFTMADKKGEVDSILNKEQFKKYKERLGIIKKEEKDAIKNLNAEIDNKLKTFSFRYSKELKQKMLEALDSI